MKCVIPEISWHNRDPVLSVDLQPLLNNNVYRLASGGGDCHVLIWLLKVLENGATEAEAVSDLTRHQRAVNVVRWSHSGQYLASGDDDANIIVWQMKTDNIPLLDGNACDKETWVVLKVFRGHKEDVYDICWSPDDCKLLSGSIDNTAIIWDFSKGKIEKILGDHKGFVQGVSWDPKNELISTASSDRMCRVFTHTGKYLRGRIGRGPLPVPDDHPLFGKEVKYFHDDTFKSYFRRLQFSPDGNLLVAPAGCVETEDCKKALNATFIFTLDDLKRPVAMIPSRKQSSVCVRFCPLLFELHPDGPDPLVSLPYRMVLAIATDTDVIIYDTQQTKPIAHLQKIHYTRLTDITWSKDGLVLVASSTDGFCTIVSFEENELGTVYKEEVTIEDKGEINVQNEEEKSVVEDVAKELEVKKRPTILEQWTIKTPKRKREESVPNKQADVDTKPSEITKESPSATVNKLTPRRVKPVQIKDDMKSPTVKKKSVGSCSTPIKKGTILSFVTTAEKGKQNENKPTSLAAIVADEEARDAWKCQNEITPKKEEKTPTEEVQCADLTEESLEDFKLEISLSQSTDVNKSKETVDTENERSDTIVHDRLHVKGADNKTDLTQVDKTNEGNKIISKDNSETNKNSETSIKNNDEVKVENKENKKLNSADTTKASEADKINTQPPVKKPRRVQLITLSSPKGKRK